MRILERTHDYAGMKRKELRSEEHELFEDFLTLAKTAENAAKFAYALSRANDAKAYEKSKEFLKKEWTELAEQYFIIEGYGLQPAKDGVKDD